MSNNINNALNSFDAENQNEAGAFDMNELNNIFAGMQEQGMDPMMLLQQMLQGVGEGEEGEQFMNMMQQFMSAINPEEIARQSTLQMINLYEQYLAEEKETLSAEDYEKYNGQLELHREVLVLIDRQASEEEFQELGQRMNIPPSEIPEAIRLQLESKEEEMGAPGENPCGPQ